MAITILSPTHSFIRFNESAAEPLCIWGSINFCLPVFEQSDINFQFVIAGTELEIDSLCTQDMSEIEVALVEGCGGYVFTTFTEKPSRSRLSLTQVLYNWEHGLPNFTSFITVGQCFNIQVTIDAHPYGYPEDVEVFCSNCFERIADDCFTSVVEYTNEADAFGFKYCNSGDAEGGDTPTIDCSPTIVPFVGRTTLAIPYTALLQAKYGVFPTVQVWIYDGSGALINMGITAAFDTYPPAMINLDFGGTASGIVVIR